MPVKGKGRKRPGRWPPLTGIFFFVPDQAPWWQGCRTTVGSYGGRSGWSTVWVRFEI